jgi:hypothetical protein
MPSSIVIFVLGMPIGDYNDGKSREFGRGSLGAILVLVGVLPQRVRNRISLAEVL